jgi:PAS domain S-box-containing protein
MMLRTNLLHRSYLLIALPLFCQVMFICALLSLVEQVEVDIRRDIQRHNASLKILTFRTAEIEDAAASMSPLDSMTTKELDEMRRKIASLASEQQENPAIRAKLFKLLSAINDLRAARIYWIPYLPSHTSEGPRFRLAMLHAIGACGAAISDLLDSEEAVVAGGGLSPTKRDRITLIIWAGAALSVLAALWLGYLYSRSIETPMKRIATNSELLSRRMPLLPASAAKDELGELDRLIHQVAKSIEDSEAQERAMISNVGELICSLSLEGEFRSVNSYAYADLGFTEEELLNKPLHDLVLPEQSLLADEYVRGAHSTRDNTVFELTLKQHDGRLIDTKWSCVCSNMGNEIFAVVQDITEQKYIDRLKRDFAGMITNELEEPLTTMLLQSNTVLSLGEELPPTAVNDLHAIENNIGKLAASVRDLIALQEVDSAIITLQKEPCSTQSLFVDALEMVESLASAKKLKVEISPNEAIVFCDREKIVRVIVNLLANAFKFSSEQEVVTLNVIENENFVEIRVIDRGPGVPEPWRTRIFEPFEQITGSLGGTGFGLATCRQIVEAHGGSIGVRTSSASGNQENGSEFWFRLIRIE